jgi:hypothetical protein
MADPLTIIGGLAASLQLVSMAGQALLNTIKLVQHLEEVPVQLAQLLDEVNDSILRLCFVCRAESKIFEMLDPTRLERLSRTAGVLHKALKETHDILTPLASSHQSKGRSMRHLCKSMVSLKVEKELARKLERLHRLNLDVVRELGVLGLEMQAMTNGLVMANSTASSHGFSSLEAKMDSLRSDFQGLSVSVQRAQGVALEYLTLEETEPPKDSQRGKSWKSATSSTCSSLESTIFPGQPQAEEQISVARAEQVRAYLATRFNAAAITGEKTLSAGQLPTANLEILIFSIRALYATGNFDASQAIPKVKFWVDTDLGIYLMKVSKRQTRGSTESQTRGFQLLRNSTANALTVLNEGTATIVIELLSTLSPINTYTCPYVRDGILSFLRELAREQLPSQHPISLVISALACDKGDKYTSLRALTSLAEHLRATLGPIHELTQLATKRLCALLRRSGDYSKALQVAGDGVRAIRAILGPSSLQERWLLRQIEHVYMDQEAWTSALGVCFDIVGQCQFDTPEPNPIYHDDCSVYTMEDIAKICECAGNIELAVVWLKQARISGGMALGQQTAVAHIQDKLYELLKQLDREEELKLWTAMMGFPCS